MPLLYPPRMDAKSQQPESDAIQLPASRLQKISFVATCLFERAQEADLIDAGEAMAMFNILTEETEALYKDFTAFSSTENNMEKLFNSFCDRISLVAGFLHARGIKPDTIEPDESFAMFHLIKEATLLFETVTTH